MAARSNSPDDSSETQMGYGDAMCASKYWRVTWFCCLMAFFNQFSGVNAVTIYSTKIFAEVNISTTLGGLITGISQFLGVIAGGFLMKFNLGFRSLMIIA